MIPIHNSYGCCPLGGNPHINLSIDFTLGRNMIKESTRANHNVHDALLMHYFRPSSQFLDQRGGIPLCLSLETHVCHPKITLLNFVIASTSFSVEYMVLENVPLHFKRKI